jgi:hypothetical protein
MVRAILNGQKVQTRRPVKHWEERDHDGWPTAWDTVVTGEDYRLRCPYGVPGDVLWVREAWGCGSYYDRVPPREIDKGTRVRYKADFLHHGHDNMLAATSVTRWRSPRFMPRWASRIDLLVTDVRAERVQEITEADACAEGVDGRGDFAVVWVVSFELMRGE